MPKIICPKCGKVWYGWALKYKECKCDCGLPLTFNMSYPVISKKVATIIDPSIPKVEVFFGGREYEGGNDD